MVASQLSTESFSAVDIYVLSIFWFIMLDKLRIAVVLVALSASNSVIAVPQNIRPALCAPGPLVVPLPVGVTDLLGECEPGSTCSMITLDELLNIVGANDFANIPLFNGTILGVRIVNTTAASTDLFRLRNVCRLHESSMPLLLDE